MSITAAQQRREAVVLAVRDAVVEANIDELHALLDEHGGEALIEYFTEEHDRDWSTSLHYLSRWWCTDEGDMECMVSLLRTVIPYCQPEWWTTVREKTYHLITALPPTYESDLDVGLTPLEVVVRDVGDLSPAFVRLLIDEARVDICAVNRRREGVLHLVASSFCPDFVRMLVDAGADPYVSDMGGETAIDKVRRVYSYYPADMCEMLDAMGAEE